MNTLDISAWIRKEGSAKTQEFQVRMPEQNSWRQGVCNLLQVNRLFMFAKTASTPPSNQIIQPGHQRVEVFTGGIIKLDNQELGRGTILWHGPGDRLNYFCDPDSLFSCIAISFKVADARYRMPRISRWDPDSPLSMEEFFLESRRLFMNRQNDPEQIAFYLGTMLMRQVFLHSADNAEAAFSTRLKLILRLFSLEDPEKLSIRNISEKTRISVSYIHYLFKRELGMTPHQYILHKRMQHARMLLQSDCPIKEIARRCGFQGTEAFYKAFRTNCGMTPGEYRKSNCIIDS